MDDNKQISLDEIKQIEFELLLTVVKICHENHLRYYLGYGTLLGAVRHQGFIPWDDDIDILMPRNDYLKLIDIISQGSFKRTKILSLQNEKDYFAPYAKVIDTRTVLYQQYNQIEELELGIYIDIFPLDGLPDDIKKSNCLFRNMELLRFIWEVSNQKFPPASKTWYKRILKSILALALKPIGYKRVLKLMEYVSTKYKYDTSDFVGCLVSPYGSKERINRHCYEGIKELEFEGIQFCVPVQYDEYLKNIYGNYMEFPLENERVPTHKWKVYWKATEKQYIYEKTT